jgi:drug/metabolite transporter (DMT)-like permease
MTTWIIFPLLAAFLWASVNHIDKYLLSKFCRNREVGGLIIFSGLIAIPASIGLLIIKPSVITNIDLISAVILILSGVCYLLAVIPYLYALEDDDVSTVAPQMILTTVFSLILGYFFLHEKLTSIQFLGTLIIIIGSLLISLDLKDFSNTKFKSRMFFLMLTATFLMSLNAFTFKYVAIEADFITSIFWLNIGYLLITVFIFLFIKKYRNQFFTLVHVNPTGIISINLISEILTIIGNISLHYATLFVPLALAEVVTEGSQPFFILLISILITKLYPSLGEKHLGTKEISIKFTAAILMAVGIILINIF